MEINAGTSTQWEWEWEPRDVVKVRVRALSYKVLFELSQAAQLFGRLMAIKHAFVVTSFPNSGVLVAMKQGFGRRGAEPPV